MTSTTHIETFEALSAISQAMLAAARLGDWDEVVILEARCKDHYGFLMHTPAPPLSADESRAKLAAIRVILSHDAEIRALAEPRLHALQAHIMSTRHARQSVRAYEAHGLPSP